MDAITAPSIDQIRRQVEAMGVALPIPPLQPIFPSACTSSIAPINPIAGISPPQSRPQLKPPEHFMYGLIRTHCELEKTVDKQTRIFNTQVERDIKEIDRLEIEKTEKLCAHAKTVKSQKTWNALSSVAQYLCAGASTTLGVMCLATGVAAPIGALLIASGLVGITGRILHDTGAFQSIAAWMTKSDELQKKIAHRMEMGMFFLSLGLGLGSGAWAYHLGVLSAVRTATLVQKVAAGIGMSASLGKGSIEFRGSFLRKNSAHEEAALQRINLEITQLFQEIHENYKETQSFIDTAANIGQELKQAISASTFHAD